MRTDAGVRDAGKVSAFVRELSPLQIGTRGKHEARAFEIIGVVRRGRPGVRWNEWHLLFDDGLRAWLGEGNGEYAIYDPTPTRSIEMADLRPGGKLDLGGETWWIMEVGEAEVIAADGELPDLQGTGPRPYADLRARGGRLAATLDGEALWVGPTVELGKLSLDQTRPIAGWSDPDVRAALVGADLAGVRAVACPSCTAQLPLTTDVASIVCKFCGAILSVEDLGPELQAAMTGQADGVQRFEERLLLPLGTRGKLDGIAWQVIGAMERAVDNSWGHWPWIEYFLYNPWHGFRWLVHDGTQGHWVLAERLKDYPEVVARTARHDGHRYRRFNAGTAEVVNVLGEFTWQVATGESAQVADYVDPPWVLSTERSNGEVAGSIGRWLSADEVARGFEIRIRPQHGIAPSQPNQFETPASIRTVAALALGAIGLGAATFAGQAVTEAPAELAQARFAVGSSDSVETFVTRPFDVPAGSRNLTVDVAGLTPEKSLVYPALVNLETGEATLLDIGGRTEGTGWLWRPSAGPWVVRLEVARGSVLSDAGRSVTVAVNTGRTWKWPSLWLVGIGMLSVGAWAAGRAQFESQRWSDADE